MHGDKKIKATRGYVKEFLSSTMHFHNLKIFFVLASARYQASPQKTAHGFPLAWSNAGYKCPIGQHKQKKGIVPLKLFFFIFLY